MAWITPIYDRTSADVDFARRNQGSTEDLKGALNYSDLNRIEGNVQYLAQTLREHGYTSAVTVKTDWNGTDIPTLKQLNRIRDNVVALINAYKLVLSAGMTLPDYGKMLNYNQINQLEFDLFYIDDMVSRMDMAYAYTGDCMCGGL